MYYFSIDFEFDPRKSQINREKHGVSFEEARELWVVPGVVREVPNYSEPRWIRIGMWRAKCYTCVYTIREERVRIISMRRSRQEEAELYHMRMNDEKESKKDFS